jgi:predicted ATP-dependent protease
MKDGPSVAVACALLLESIISGVELDRNFAVTGDMNADGTVQPVGGIDGKIRGSVKARCIHVGIPVENKKSISDIFLLGGVQEVCKIQILVLL